MGTSSSSPRRNPSNQHPHPPPFGYYPPAPPPVQNYSHPPPHLVPNYNFPGWYSSHHQIRALPPPPPMPYVQQNTKMIKNDVNVHKDSIRLEIDQCNPDQYLVSFVLDAMFDGSITIYYFAKEEDKCKLTPLMPEAFKTVKVPFQKGLGQKFCQPTGTGIDLGFFELGDLEKPSADGDAYPLVISAEACSSISNETGDEDGHSPPPPSLQITQAVLQKNNGAPNFQVKVVKQILWIDGVRYEIRELYGIEHSSENEFTDDDSGKECVICLTEPKDTAIMPCRHMCMCSGCAKELRIQSNKCPICRQPITELLQIKLNSE